MWTAILNALKASPGLVWALMIYIYINGPKENVSQFSRWATRLGFRDLPEFLIAKTADEYVASAAISLLVIYIIFVWIWPWWRARHPRWTSFYAATQRAYEFGEKHNLLGLVNIGIFTEPLDYFSHGLMSDGSVRFRGRRAQPTKSYPITLAERKNMKSVPTASRLKSNLPNDPFTYEDVEVRSWDVRHYMRKFRRLSNEASRERAA